MLLPKRSVGFPQGGRKHVLACYLHIAPSRLVLQVLRGPNLGLCGPLQLPRLNLLVSTTWRAAVDGCGLAGTSYLPRACGARPESPP